MVISVTQLITDARAEIEQVSPETAAEELAAGAAVVDVREPVEWEQYVPGAIQVPRGLLEFVADPASPRHNAALDPTKRVIVYCASGARAALATLTLKRMGYEHVANLDGGFKAWLSAGLPTSTHHGDL